MLDMYLGYKAKNHPQQIAARGACSLTDDRGTTKEVFKSIEERWGPFTLDVAAAPHNAKCDRFFSEGEDGLDRSWAGERVWCNPPYSDLRAWVEKAWAEHLDAEIIAMLLPANRTEQRWWQDLVEPHRDRPGSPLRVEFLRGRLRFILPGHDRVKPNQRPPFGCCLLIFRQPPRIPHPDDDNPTI